MEAGLREQLAAAQRIMRLAQLSRQHQQSGAEAAAEPVPEAAALGGAEDAGASEGSGPLSDCPDALQALGLPAGSAGQRLLEVFSRRMGAAALDGAALARERQRLAAENAALRAALAKVQAGSTVGPGALDDPLNTLLVVNGRLQQALHGNSNSST